MSRSTTSEVVAVVLIPVAFLFFMVVIFVSVERNDYHTQLCTQWLANAEARVDSLQIFLDDSYCHRKDP